MKTKILSDANYNPNSTALCLNKKSTFIEHERLNDYETLISHNHWTLNLRRFIEWNVCRVSDLNADKCKSLSQIKEIRRVNFRVQQ